jgi:hypothetical protein
MTQNLISLTFSAEDLAAIHAAVRALEEKLAALIELSVDERRRLNKMGDKTEAACRQTLIVLAQNRQLLPPGFDLPEAERDLATLDQLRPVFARIRQLAARGDDTEMALGSDILSASLEGYALAKAIGKGAALDALRESMGEALRLADESSRFSVDSPWRRHARRQPDDAIGYWVDSPWRRHASSSSIPGLESWGVKPDSPRLELESSLRMRESPELGLESPKLGRASSRFTRDALKFDGESELRARVPESRH